MHRADRCLELHWPVLLQLITWIRLSFCAEGILVATNTDLTRDCNVGDERRCIPSNEPFVLCKWCTRMEKLEFSEAQQPSPESNEGDENVINS